MTIQIRPILPTICLTVITCAVWFCQTVTGGDIFTYHTDSTLSDYLLYHFSHANIFHLLGNLLALWLFRPRLSTVLIAYPIATLAALLDTLLLSIINYKLYIISPLPTCGLSALLFASFARYYVAWHKPIYPILIPIIITAFLPYINWHIHLLSFLLAYPVFHIWYRLKNPNSQKSKTHTLS